MATDGGPTSASADTVAARPGTSADMHARRARSFGAVATAYEEHRPDYPADALAWAFDALGERSGLHVLDLAAGTGKLTASLLAAPAGARIGRLLAGEPDPGMGAEFARRLPEVPLVLCTAEQIPLRTASLDAVVVGQAFHWFDHDRALTEIARVLRPGGLVAAFSNVSDDSVDWVAAHERIAELGLGHSRKREEAMPPGAHPLYGPPEQTAFPHAQRTTAAGVSATVSTHSRSLVRPEPERGEVLAAVEAQLRAVHGAAAFDFPLVTRVRRMRTIGA